MARLRICTYPDPILRKRAEPVTRFDDALRRTLDDMAETMYASDGIGLAGPQVGLSRRVIVVDVPGSDERKPTGLLYLVNPRVVRSAGTITYKEGCLSFPGLEIEIDRPDDVTVEYQDATGQPKKIDAKELVAVCLQHEIDHLDGRVFVDRVSSIKRQLALKEWEKNREDEPRK